MSNEKNEKMGTSEITKVAQRTSKGVVTGTVYVLETINNYLGKHYTFSMTAGEFGQTISQVSYRRLPSKIRGLFN